MKTLFLLRHAKSSWDEPALADYDRPLNDRGRRTAPLMGKLMRKEGFAPDIIFCSTAKRAWQTVELLKEAGKFKCEIIFDERIYEASPGSLQHVITEIGDHDSAMLVGHNPGMESFIRFLTNNIETMPTAALAVMDLAIEDWAHVKKNCGELRNIYRPKDEIR